MMKAVSRVDAEPLLRALTVVRDEARKARERSSMELEDVLRMGAKAHQALMWFAADQEGEVEAAQRWLDQLLSGPPSTPRQDPSRGGPPGPAPAR